MVTGYYEPLLAGSRTRTPRYAVPLYAAPDDLLTIDLTELYPELKDKRLRGRVDGRRVVPYWPRADIDGGKAPVAAKALVYVEDPVEAFFLQIQGSGRVQLAEGGIVRVGYADQNGHPYRSIGRVLVERGELPLERASMQGIREWGRRNPEKLGPLLDENPSYVFFREVPAPAPGTLEARDRRAVRHARRAAAARAHDRRRHALDSARRAGVSRDDLSAVDEAAAAADARAGHRRRDPRRRARRLLLGLRRRRRAAGGTDEAGRADVDPVAEGRCPRRHPAEASTSSACRSA